MRDAGDEPAKRGHLLRHQHALLRLGQFLVRGIEFAVGALQFADRPADQNHADETAAMVAARRAIDRDQRVPAVGRGKRNVALRHDAAILQLRQEACDRLAAVGIKEIGQRHGEKVALAASDGRFQRRIDLLDQPVRVADDQHVGHRRDHRADKGMRLFEPGVLFFKFGLRIDEFGIDLVHLLDHVDPDVLPALAERQRPVRWRLDRQLLVMVGGQHLRPIPASPPPGVRRAAA